MTSWIPRAIHPPRAALACAAGLLLAGCASGKVTEVVGLGKAPPDEFTVTRSAPLTQPPDYSLLPPAEAARRAAGAAASDALPDLGILEGAGDVPARPAVADGSASAGEAALLRQAGAASAGVGIRTVIDRENAAPVSEDPGLVDRLLFWQSVEKPDAVLDPAAETQRIKDSTAAGEAVNAGDSPLILVEP